MKLKLGGKTNADEAKPEEEKTGLSLSLAKGNDKTSGKTEQSEVKESTANPLGAVLTQRKPGLLLETSTPLSNVLTEKAESLTINKAPHAIPEVVTEKYKILADIPDTLDAAVVEDFQTKMQSVLDNMGNHELQNSMMDVLEYTQAHPELKEILRPEDVQLFVRGARKAYAGVLINKNTNKAKSSKKAERLAELEEALGDLDLGL